MIVLLVVYKVVVGHLGDGDGNEHVVPAVALARAEVKVVGSKSKQSPEHTLGWSDQLHLNWTVLPLCSCCLISWLSASSCE